MNEIAGKLVWRGFDGTDLPGWLADQLRRGATTGIVLFARNVEEPRQVHALCAAAARAAGSGPPPVVSVDQEGGRVARLRDPHFTRFPSARLMAGPDDPDLTRRLGRAMGLEMRSVGVNLDFAPVMDVQESLEGVVGDRSFGGDPALVTRHALAWLEGLESAGVAGCVKHFPGHGDASCDSHVDLPVADGDAPRTRTRHLPPFEAAVRAGVQAVMAGHLVVPHMDPDRPATLSSTLVSSELRVRLAFDGVVVTDDMRMGAIARGWGIGDAAVEAVAAGCDALLVCSGRDEQEQAVEAIGREAGTSAAFAALVARSAARIDGLRRRLQPVPAELDPSIPGRADHVELVAEVRR